MEGSKERLRPILMTMGTAILAMVPIAIGGTQMGGDGPAYYPMARAIAGGLAFSTIVSLLFLPTIYAILDDLRAGTARVISRARGKPDRKCRVPQLRRSSRSTSHLPTERGACASRRSRATTRPASIVIGLRATFPAG